MHRAITRCRWHAFKKKWLWGLPCKYRQSWFFQASVNCRCSVCSLDTSLLCCSFSGWKNHRGSLPQGLPGRLFVGKTCLFLLKRILFCLLHHFILLRTRRLSACSARASFPALMDPESWHPIWHGLSLL